jgi:DNA replication protein DnaC
MRLDFLVLDELGYLPFAQAGGQLLFHLISRLEPPRDSRRLFDLSYAAISVASCIA